ncbi:MAG: hypothetical protein IJT49_00675 [Clostridia bacterium]|nr:hypothetical protein [Clostridia bacterium]
MDKTNNRSKQAPFFEVKQRYCSKLDGNVVLKRELGTDKEFTCMSSHVCGENCKAKEKEKGGVT